MYSKLVYLITFAVLLGSVGSVANAKEPFQQDDVPGAILSIEAENFDDNVPQGDHIWELVTDPTGFSGDGAMRALPDTGDLIINDPGDYLIQCPRLDYKVNFIKSGTHYIWVRCYMINNETNSCHVGINGTHNATSDRVGNIMTYFEWLWASDTELDQYERLTMDIPSPGVHTINVWMREDGYWFDKIVFTTDPDYTPTGLGPEESVRGPRTRAFRPTPENGEVLILPFTSMPASLAWYPGSASVSHDVYFGTDANDVAEASPADPRGVLLSQNQEELTFDTPDVLEFDQEYYWRVDEVNEADPNSPWKGNIWSFSTANFIVVDDFEDYNDWEPYTVYITWEDGWNDPLNGATAGHPAPIFFNDEHYVETTIVHGGGQSMPIFYDNSAGMSEVTRTFNEDWTRDDVITLTLFYYGDANNVVEPLYVALDDVVVTHENPGAVLDNYWTQWDIALQEFADRGVDLTSVGTMSIGMGDRANPQPGGGTGFVFIDDIRLYRTPPVEPEPVPEPVDPGTDNLLAYYAFDNNTEDSSGNGLHATMEGNPRYVAGLANYDFGMALEFDASFDHVVLPIGSAIAEMNDITVSCWADFYGGSGAWQRLWDFGVLPEGDNDPNFYMFVTPRWGTGGGLRFAIATGIETNITAPETLPSGWHHVVAVIDSSTTMMKLYQDGRLVAEGETPALPSDIGVTNQNFLGRSQFAADDFYLGSLDEFRIYDRALTEGEVRFLAGK
jgi:hypothetical protein